MTIISPANLEYINRQQRKTASNVGNSSDVKKMANIQDELELSKKQATQEKPKKRL